MLDYSLKVDVLHPGHYLACRGLQTVAKLVTRTDVQGRFSEGSFTLTDINPSSVVHALATCEVTAESWNPAKKKFAATYWSKMPESGWPEAWRKAAPLTFLGMRLDWWLDASIRALKMWSGQQSSLGNFIAQQKALAKLPWNPNLLSSGTAMGGKRFGFDPVAGAQAIDVGFSTDRVGLAPITFPAVELLAAIGLQNHRPRHVGNGAWEYEVLGKWYRFGLQSRGKFKALSWAEEHI